MNFRKMVRADDVVRRSLDGLACCFHFSDTPLLEVWERLGGVSCFLLILSILIKVMYTKSELSVFGPRWWQIPRSADHRRWQV